MERTIFHVDVNNAFLSWEATHRKATGNNSTDLRDIPSIVGGDRRTRHGIVLAKSMPAKKMGIKTAQTINEALKLCPNLVIVPSNFPIYKKYSKMFKDILKEYSPAVESFSIDEAFIDYTGCERLFGNPIDAAYKIKERIKNELGFSVNVGVSTNKFLAKMASDLVKPDKVITLFPYEIEKKLYPLDIGEMFMVGKKTKAKLNELGIYTIEDLALKDKDFLTRHFKNSFGTMLYEYSHGIDNTQVNFKASMPKSISHSITLPKDISDKNELKKILLSLSESVGIRLRQHNLKGDIISVTLKNSMFISYSKQLKISKATNSTKEIYNYSVTVLEKLWNAQSIRLVGVSVNNLCEDNYTQMSFIESKNSEKQEKIDKTIDIIRESFGKNVITRGAFINSNIKPPMEKIDFTKDRNKENK